MSCAASASDDAILEELVAWAVGDPRLGLLQFGSRVAARQYRPLYAAFRAAVPAGARVLDWGAGNGHFSYFLARAGYRATAYAFAPPALLEAAGAQAASGPEAHGAAALADGAARGAGLGAGAPVVVAASPAEPVRLPFPDAAFDAACSIGVLEHVGETGGDERASLAELARVLAPGGVLFACHLPNRGSWVEFLARHAPVSGVHHHPRRFGRGEIRALLAGAGLTPLRMERYALLPRNGWARVPRLGGSRFVADLWDGLDRLLTRAAPWLATNWLVVARKAGAPPPAGAARP